MSNLTHTKIKSDNLTFTSYTEDKTNERYEIPLKEISEVIFIQEELGLTPGFEHINLQNMVHKEIGPSDLAILLWENQEDYEVHNLLTKYKEF